MKLETFLAEPKPVAKLTEIKIMYKRYQLYKINV